MGVQISVYPWPPGPSRNRGGAGAAGEAQCADLVAIITAPMMSAQPRDGYFSR
jgi:hypothetical protein|eukprot:SAG25_NODE_1003_length_4345_cov_1061.500225_1_plen_53_part_00